MKITLPPDFNYAKPHENLLFCPTCQKYQHFRFNRVREWMECCGCGARHTWYGMEEMQPDTNERKGNRRPVYGPPKYLMIYNNWKEHPEFTDACLWRFFYWDVCSYSTIQRYLRCIRRDLKGL